MPPELKRLVSIRLRVSPAEYDLLSQASQTIGTTIGRFCRDPALANAKRIMVEAADAPSLDPDQIDLPLSVS